MGYTTSTTTTDRVVEAAVRFMEAGAIAADTPYEATVSLTVPESAPPSAEGEITRVRWWVVATLARPRRRDVQGAAELVVLSRACAPLDPGRIAAHGTCELSFELDRDDFGPGETVEGTLVANALRECEMRELRVEVVRHEEVPRDEGNEVDVREAEAVLDSAISLSPGGPREWPFRLVLPEVLVPSLRTDQTRVTWLVRGVGSRRLRPDFRITEPVDVHTAP